MMFEKMMEELRQRGYADPCTALKDYIAKEGYSYIVFACGLFFFSDASTTVATIAEAFNMTESGVGKSIVWFYESYKALLKLGNEKEACYDAR